jgi:uncharacterized protein
MRFENTFDVDAPVDEVYSALLDVERVAPCVPGAEVLGKSGDDAYDVAIKVKVGPISMTYKGTVEIVERDPEEHRAVMRARARETRGQGTADARVQMSLDQDGAKTNGTMVSDVQLAGRAAAMGRGVIQDVSAKIIDTFAANLAAMLGAGGQPVAAGGPPPPSEAAPPPPGAAQTPLPGSEHSPAPGGASGAPAAPAQPATGAAAAAPRPTPPAPAPATESSLPVGKIVGSVLAARLKDPRVIGGLAASVLALAAAVRWRRNG